MTGRPRYGSGAVQTGMPPTRRLPVDRRPPGLDGVLTEARRIRASLGLEVEPDQELVALALAAVGFVAGDGEDRLRSAWRRWRAAVTSPEAARADLSAVRLTLQTRLGGPCTRVNSLVDALIALEDASGPAGPLWLPL